MANNIKKSDVKIATEHDYLKTLFYNQSKIIESESHRCSVQNVVLCLVVRLSIYFAEKI